MNNYGFTLIELLVVIAIIGTLATIGFIALTSSQQGANESVTVSELQTIRSAITINYVSAKGLPEVVGGKGSIALKTSSSAGVLGCELADTANSIGTKLAGKVEGIDWSKYVFCADKAGTGDGARTVLIGTVAGGALDSKHTFLTGSAKDNVPLGNGTVALDCRLKTAPAKTIPCIKIEK